MFQGFEPVFDENSRILILGSFPSVISRSNKFYYGNPQNRFWNVLEKIFGESFGENAESKTATLKKYGLALWDVAISCDIKGSSDSDIKMGKYLVSDLKSLLDKTPKLEKIICNGKKAYEIYTYNYKDISLPCKSLPSTSSANTKFDYLLWEKELII